MHTNKPGPARRPFWEWNIYDLYTPLSGQFDINGVRLSEIAAQYCHLTREPQVDKLDRKWRCNILCWLWSWSKMASESLCVLRWRLVYPELTLAASFSSLAVSSGLCVGYNQMEEWSEHNKYDWYSPAQAWPDNYEGFGREGEEWERDSHQIYFLWILWGLWWWKKESTESVILSLYKLFNYFYQHAFIENKSSFGSTSKSTNWFCRLLFPYLCYCWYLIPVVIWYQLRGYECPCPPSYLTAVVVVNLRPCAPIMFVVTRSAQRYDDLSVHMITVPSLYTASWKEIEYWANRVKKKTSLNWWILQNVTQLMIILYGECWSDDQWKSCARCYRI